MDALEQPVLVMITATSLTVATRKSVNGCRREEVGGDKGWPDKSKKMDFAEEFNGDDRAEWIDEESKEKMHVLS